MGEPIAAGRSGPTCGYTRERLPDDLDGPVEVKPFDPTALLAVAGQVLRSEAGSETRRKS
jgi:hypothetical protein